MSIVHVFNAGAVIIHVHVIYHWGHTDSVQKSNQLSLAGFVKVRGKPEYPEKSL